MDRRSFIHVSLLTMAVALTGPSAILYAIAQQQGTAPAPHGGSRGGRWMGQLTDDQKAQIQKLTQSMKDSGATQQQINDAINAKLKEWGIQIPERPTDSPREPPWMSQLTDDQKTEIQQLIQSMKDSGATPQEIGDAINAKLQKWGIQLPERPTDSPREPPWMSQLTDDQKAQIQQLTQSMKDAGASPQKIGDAVNAKLQEWGIRPPECSGGQPTDSTRPLRDPPWMSRLTDDQKTQIQQLIQTMKDSGATPQNIRDAINSKLQEWGIELPVPPQRPGP